MRKGSFLVEVLVVVLIVPILMIGLSRMFNTLLTETPRLWDDVQQNSTMLNLLSQIQCDIDKANSLSQSENPQSAGSQLVVIELSDAVISYEFENQRVIRHVKTDTQEAAEERIWLIPDAKIEWKVLEKTGKGYALEVLNHIEYQKGKRLENKMANSHLFFTGAL